MVNLVAQHMTIDIFHLAGLFCKIQPFTHGIMTVAEHIQNAISHRPFYTNQ
jgi:hypothetical protein